MDFDFSDDQKAMAAEVRRFLAAHFPTDDLRRRVDNGAPFDAAAWGRVTGMGLPGVAIPEAYGGVGAGYLELCLVAEELGRALATTPLNSSIFLAAEFLTVAGTQEQRTRWLPPLAAGTSIGTFAAVEGEAGDPTAMPAASVANGRLSGTKRAVPDGDLADFAVVTATVEGMPGLFIVDLNQAGVVRSQAQTMDLGRNHVSVTFDSVSVEALGPVPAGEVLDRVLDRAAILTAFEQLGGADRALEMACGYARERLAFGRPIGSFQAIKHMLAEMYVAATLARANCYFAAWALAEDAPDLPLAAAAARLSATAAYRHCARDNIQVHGGIGFTWESDCHLHYRRSHALAVNLGSPERWERRLVDEIEARGMPA